MPTDRGMDAGGPPMTYSGVRAAASKSLLHDMVMARTQT